DGGCGVWRTPDGGASWRVLARPGALGFDRVAAVGRTLTLSSWEANSLVSRVSRDGGSSWTPAVHAADAFQLAVSARTAAVAQGAPWLRGVVRIRHAGRVTSFRIPGDSLIGVALASDSVAYVAADVRSLVQSCPDDTPIVAASVWVTGDAGGSWRRLH